MAIQNERWESYLIDRFWKDNSFLKGTSSETSFVVGGRIVHIPQPGDKPTVVKNRSTFPATSVQRTDTDITYTLDAYTTNPSHILEADKAEISYDKLSSVYGDHSRQLSETIAEDWLIKVLTGIGATGIVNATGAASAAGLVSGQTGTRKVVMAADIKNLKRKFDLQNAPNDNRYLLLEANMLDQLTSDLSLTQYRDFSQYFDAATGAVGKLFGFTIMMRSSVAIASSANAINALGQSVAATDNVVSIAWQKECIASALGDVKFFENKNDPQYYGDVYSAIMRMGGRRKRSDDTGVFALIGGA